MNLPEKLVLLRKQKGFTQMELAEALKVSRQAISRWEVGTAAPSTDNLKELSNLYDVSVDYLLQNNADDSTKPPEVQQITTNPLFSWLEKKMHLVIIALSLILAIVMVICTTVVKLREEEENRIIPISELNCEEADNGYPTIYFSFD